LKLESSAITGYVSSNKRITIDATGGDLHGAWNSEATLTTSDRRLKTSIEPLYRTLAGQVRSRGGESPAAPLAATMQKPGGDAPVNWLLRELRPVSFRLKRGPEAKYLKFGFIAQELENVFPNLVRTTGVDDTKSVAMQDLVAVLTLALQNLQKDFDDQNKLMEAQQIRLERLERHIFGQSAGGPARPMHV
jgi:hypothetical protein